MFINVVAFVYVTGLLAVCKELVLSACFLRKKIIKKCICCFYCWNKYVKWHANFASDKTFIKCSFKTKITHSISTQPNAWDADIENDVLYLEHHCYIFSLAAHSQIMMPFCIFWQSGPNFYCKCFYNLQAIYTWSANNIQQQYQQYYGI